MGEKKEKHGTPEEFDPEFKGPVKNSVRGSRSCNSLGSSRFRGQTMWTWGTRVGVFFPKYTLTNQTYMLISNRDKPYLFFFDLLSCLQAGATVLVSGCPTPQICVAECPQENYVSVGGNSEDADNLCLAGVDLSKSLTDLVKDNECAAYYVSSEPILKRCLPKALSEILKNGKLLSAAGSDIVDKTGEAVNATDLKAAAEVVGYLSNLEELGTQILSDVQNTWWIIIICVALVGLVSLLFLILLRFIAGPMIWTLIVLFVVGFGISAAYCFIRYDSLKDNESAQGGFKLTTSLDYYTGLADTWLVGGVILAIVCLLILLLTLLLFKRIRIAIGIIEQTSKALAHMMSVLLWPVVPFILQIMIFAFGIASFLHIYVLASGRSTATYSSTSEVNVTNYDGSLTTKLQTTLQDIPCDSD
ncbi:hypothetical protein CAPTEDRAFT_222050, partial [Capitella teleta]